MRVLHIDTATEWRGGQNQIVLTAEEQAARGHEVSIFANAQGELAARASKFGLSVHRARVGRGDLSRLTLSALRQAAHRFQPEVIHVHESHGLVGAFLAARALHQRPRLVASRRVDFPLRFISRLKYARMNKVLAVSEAVCAILIRDGLAHDKVLVVHEGVKDRPPALGGPQALSSLGVPEGAPLIGNVAQLVDHKDHATLLRAAAIVSKTRPECCFLICGDGPLKPDLVSLATALGIAGQVIFGGFRNDLDALIPSFDVFCLSSHLEGLGTSVLDAMCFARPVVATRAGGIPDAVVDGETGRLVPPRDPEASAQALLDTLGSSETLRLFGQAGRSRFLQKFTSAAMAEATLRAYVFP